MIKYVEEGCLHICINSLQMEIVMSNGHSAKVKTMTTMILRKGTLQRYFKTHYELK